MPPSNPAGGRPFKPDRPQRNSLKSLVSTAPPNLKAVKSQLAGCGPRLERFWHPHMVWHGPVGIGSAYGLDEFKRNAQGPIVRAFPDRKGIGHQARIAEGAFAALHENAGLK